MTAAFIEFEIQRPERMEALGNFISALRRAKNTHAFPADAEWDSYLDAEAKSYFWNPSPEEQKEWEQAWNSAPVEARHQDLSLWPHWELGSWLDALSRGEFLVHGLEAAGKSQRLSFEPQADPFGGIDCLVAIIEAFGQRVIGVNDGAGYTPYIHREHWKSKG